MTCIILLIISILYLLISAGTFLYLKRLEKLYYDLFRYSYKRKPIDDDNKKRHLNVEISE